MKQYAASLAIVVGFVAIGFTYAADDIPTALPLARYAPMMKRSPFAVASAAAIPAATPNFAKDLYIANAAHTSEGDLVTLASSTDKNFKKYLSTKAPVDGYSVPNIEWSDRVGATRVTITKGGQTATLSFNEALLSQGLPNSAPQFAQPQEQQQQIPGVPGVPAVPRYSNPNGIKPAPIPTLPTPPPRVRGVIPRNPNMRTQPEPEAPQQPLVQDE